MRSLQLSLLVLAGLGSIGVHASYMSVCDNLIASWKQCSAGGGQCTAQAKLIETNCKCHVFQNGSWKFVKPGSAGINVCADWPPGSPPQPIDPNPPRDSSHGKIYTPKEYPKGIDPAPGRRGNNAGEATGPAAEAARGG